MTSRPIQTNGVLHFRANEWVVTLDATDPAFEDGTPLRLVLWDERSAGSRPEVEQIAAMQQLDVEIVALALSAEGGMNS